MFVVSPRGRLKTVNGNVADGWLLGRSFSGGHGRSSRREGQPGGQTGADRGRPGAHQGKTLYNDVRGRTGTGARSHSDWLHVRRRLPRAAEGRGVITRDLLRHQNKEKILKNFFKSIFAQLQIAKNNFLNNV